MVYATTCKKEILPVARVEVIRNKSKPTFPELLSA